MFSSVRRLAAFLCAFLASFFVFSASDNSHLNQTFLSDYVHRVYTTADGLPGMTVTAILQDKKGYIWLGTYDGLVRFDGVEFVVFSRFTDSKYDFAAVRSLFEDSEGNLWVGHNDEGLTCFKPDGTITKYNRENGLPHNCVRSVCEDKDGNIWIGTSGGIRYLDASGALIEPAGLFALGEETISVIQLLCDTAGRIWVTTGSKGDLFVYSGGKFSRFLDSKRLESLTVRSVFQDKNGAFWFGADPHYVIRIKDGEETEFDVRHENTDVTAVDSISQDRSGNMWFSMDGGITILSDGTFICYDKSNGSPDNGVNRVLEDSEGNFWIPYNRGGLEKLSRGKFRTVQMGATVNAVAEDTFRGVTWIATDDGVRAYKDGLFVDNEIVQVTKGARVRHVYVTEDGEILISSYSDSIPQIVVSKENEIKIWTKEECFDQIKNRVSIRIRNGDYYAGTTNGLYIKKHEDGSFITFKKSDGFENEYIMWLYEDKKGRIWVGTNGAGVYIMKDRHIIKHYSTTEGLADNVIFKVSTINDEIWIATSTGLSEYNEESETFFNFNSNTGLGTDSVFQILVDYTNTAWMTTNKGIFSADFSDLLSVSNGKRERVSVKYYGNSDGLVTSGVTAVSAGRTDSLGRTLFPLVDGFAIYDPVKSGKNTVAPKIEFEDYTIDTERYDYHGEDIVLPAGTKRFSIKFTGLSFISSESIRFRYKLDGFDEEFSDWDAVRVATYTNLKHGNYQLKVMSENSDGVSGAPVVLSLSKEPYIWELLWFWVGIGVFVVLFVTLIVLIKIHKMRVYQIELEKKVEERTHELKVANKKAENLLLNILPSNIAAELTEHPNRTIAKKYPNATVIFTDIVGFTKMSNRMTAENVVAMLNKMISRFDERAKHDGIEKIKTIGDSYMAACGLSENPSRDEAVKMIHFAQGLLRDVQEFNNRFKVNIQIRVGINTGNLVAGVIGKAKFIYDIWGDTVNVASRMESTGTPMKIHVSETTYEQTKDSFPYGEAVEVAVKARVT